MSYVNFFLKAKFEISETAEITQQRRSEEVGRQDIVRVMRWVLRRHYS